MNDTTDTTQATDTASDTAGHAGDLGEVTYTRTYDAPRAARCSAA